MPKTNLEVIKTYNNIELSIFILQVAPKIYRRYTDSYSGLAEWLNQEYDEKEGELYGFKYSY